MIYSYDILDKAKYSNRIQISGCQGCGQGTNCKGPHGSLLSCCRCSKSCNSVTSLYVCQYSSNFTLKVVKF